MASSAKKWQVSREAYNNNKNANLQKLMENTSTDYSSYLDDYYNAHPVSKYYFRSDDRNKEYQNILDSIKTGELNKFNDLYQQGNQNYVFNPGGKYNYDFTNDYTTSFLDDQYNNVLGQLDAALKRGTINQKGYDSGLADLNKQLSGAKSTVGDYINQLKTGYQDELQTAINNQTSAMNDFNVNSTMGVDNFGKMLDDMYNKQQNNYQQDFDAATIGLNPFDFGSTLANAQTNQGLYNPITDNNANNNPLLNAISDNTKDKNKKVGLGNSGLF